MIAENVSTLKIHKLTQEQYDRELAAGNIDENALYLTPDEELDLSGYATKEDLETKSDSNHMHSDLETAISGKSDIGHTHTAEDVGADPVGTATAKANEVQANLDSVKDEFTDHVDNADVHFTATERNKLSGIATGANNYSHPDSGVTAGTYKSVTINAQGHVTAGTNPTTLAGYGITDAASTTDLEELTEIVNAKADASHNHDDRYYTKTQIDNLELITTDDIDTICGTTIQVASASEVTF